MTSRIRALGAFLVAAVACALALTACGGSGSSGGTQSGGGSTTSGGGELTFNTWGGAYQEAQQKTFVPAFEQQTGTKVNVTNPIDYAKLKAMVQNGNVVWDVADVEPYVAYQDCKNGLLERLDYNVIRTKFLRSMPPTDCSVPNGAFGLALAYNTDKYKAGNRPTSWADFFDTTKFPGQRAVPNYAESGILEAALLADGVPRDRLYPLDYQRAFRKLDTIKDDLVFWQSGDQSEQLMESGEVSMCACWPTRMYDAHANQGTPIGIEWNNALYGYDVDVIPKGAPNVANGQRFIAFLTSPQQEIAMTRYTPWGPSAVEAADNPSPVTKAWNPTTPEHRATGVPIDYSWWGPNSPALDRQFSTWLLQK
ncbi:MAG TPA: ABC transporter substrate-binding protein [Conexibacter sp.]|nr:ABC transporter substrate-binding protein [Conexibacter sp.]